MQKEILPLLSAKFLLVFSVIMTSLFWIQAQEKWEYATARYYLLSGERYKIELSTESKIEVVDEGTTSQYGKWSRDYDNASPVIKWISENGWEPLQFCPPSNANNSTYFLLRRKKSQ